MNDRAESAHSKEQAGGGTPLTQWGRQAGDQQDSADIDDAFADLLKKSPVRSSKSDSSVGDGLDAPDVSNDWHRRPEKAIVDDIGTEDTFDLLGYLLKPDSPDQAELGDPSGPVARSTEVGAETHAGVDQPFLPSLEADADEPPALSAGPGKPTLPPVSPNRAPLPFGDADTDDPLLPPSNLELSRDATPDFATRTVEHPADDLVGSPRFSSEVLNDSDRGGGGVVDPVGVGDEGTRFLEAQPAWQPQPGQPAWHPDAPANLQHSAVVNWHDAPLPSRTVRSPGETRRPRGLNEVVGEVTDRPWFWKSVAAAAFLVIGTALYTAGVFGRFSAGGGEPLASQIAANETVLPPTASEDPSPDSLGDPASAAGDDVDELGAISERRSSDPDPAAPSRQDVARSSDSGDDVTTLTTSTAIAEESTTTTTSPQSTSATTQPATSTTATTGTTPTTARATSTAGRPTSSSTTAPARSTTTRPPSTAPTTRPQSTTAPPTTAPPTSSDAPSSPPTTEATPPPSEPAAPAPTDPTAPPSTPEPTTTEVPTTTPDSTSAPEGDGDN